MSLDWQHFLPHRLRPSQKALVGQVPAALTVHLRYHLSANYPFLLHCLLLDGNSLPGEYHIVGVLRYAGAAAAATSSGGA
ncbi:MAG: hypothetical protein PVH80_06600, partial [Anaerolineae bacterium]